MNLSVVETRTVSDKSAGCLMTGRAATCVDGAGVGHRHLRGTAGTRLLMQREKLKRAKPQGKSTDAGDWGGLPRMSVEGPVMGPEQRGRIRWSYCLEQLETG